MKRLALTGVASVVLALSSFAQGFIDLNDAPDPNGVAIGAAGNYYSGTFGMEVWELNGTSVPAGINLNPTVGSGLTGYNTMRKDGFTKEATFAGQTMFSGTFALGEVDMPDVTPAGSTVVLGLAVWNTSASSWATMLASANGDTCAGVIAFVNPTMATGGLLPPNSLSGFTTGDLVMTSVVPEPSLFALAGLGAAILLTFCRWKRLQRARSARAAPSSMAP